MTNRNQKMSAKKLLLPNTEQKNGLSGRVETKTRERKRKSEDFKSSAWYEKAKLSIGAASK
jgi:hypothetical protein